MIRNFEKETDRLSEYEKENMLPVVREVLERAVGKSRAITNSQIVGRYLPGASEARVRKIINHIRNRHIIDGLMATTKGYYVATTREELEGYVESLQGRISAIRKVMQSIRRQMNRMFPVKGKGVELKT